MGQKDFINEQKTPKKSISAQKTELSSDEIRARDKNKGRYRTQNEKNQTKEKNSQYINDYNKRHYIKTVFAFLPEDRVLLETQAKLSGETLTQYVVKLIKNDQKNYDADAFKKIYDDKFEKYSEKFNKDKPLSSVLKQETIKEKEEMTKKIIKDAGEYFGKDPFSVSKTERAKYILKITNYGEDKGLIQTYCNALEVSRAWFYMCMQKMKEE